MGRRSVVAVAVDALRDRKRRLHGGHCNLTIEVSWLGYRPFMTVLWDPLLRFAGYFVWLTHSHVPCAFLSVNIEDGLVENTRFQIQTEVPRGFGPRWEHRDREPPGYISYADAEYGLIAYARAVRTVDTHTLCCFWPGAVPHPQYQVSSPGGCMNCIAIYTDISSAASQEEKKRLTGFNFNCFTQWDPCVDEEDIMPEAGSELTNQRAARKSHESRLKHCDFALHKLAESSFHAALVETQGIGTDSRDETKRLQLKLVRSLDPGITWKAGQVRSVAMALDRSEIQRMLRLHAAYIALMPTPDIVPGVGLYPCGLQPYSEANTKLVSEAVAEGKGLPPDM